MVFFDPDHDVGPKHSGSLKDGYCGVRSYMPYSDHNGVARMVESGIRTIAIAACILESLLQWRQQHGLYLQ